MSSERTSLYDEIVQGASELCCSYRHTCCDNNMCVSGAPDYMFRLTLCGHHLCSLCVADPTRMSRDGDKYFPAFLCSKCNGVSNILARERPILTSVRVNEQITLTGDDRSQDKLVKHVKVPKELAHLKEEFLGGDSQNKRNKKE